MSFIYKYIHFVRLVKVKIPARISPEHFVRKQLITLFFNCIVITTLSAFEQNVQEKCGLDEFVL